jgi:HEAT repeat protein
MDTKRRRNLFGPLLFGTLVLACLILVGFGVWSLWPTWRQYLEMRTYASELRGSSPLFAQRAAEKLARAGPVAVPWLTDAARNPDARVRSLAFSTLGYTLPVSKGSIRTLVAGLKDDDARARCDAADALGRLGPDAVIAADALAGAFRDGEPWVRLRAARAIWRIGGKASELAPPVLLSLVAQAAVTSPPVRLDATDVIVKMGGETEARALSSLISLTDSEALAVRREAIECLERFGPRARNAIPALERALGDDDRVVRCLAALALSEIEGWEKGRARSLLKGMVDDPALSPRMRKPVRWVIDSNLVNDSEFSQPVHVLRQLVAELRQAE